MTESPLTDPDLPSPRGFRWSPHAMAVGATAFTWPLLFVGGLVTTYRVGMAVPDWPTTFGVNMFLYNMFDASWGVFGEHAHRLYASAVGLFTILLTVDFLLYERRPRIKGLAVLALLLVIAQGVMGGMRVRWNSTGLAAFHGVFGQAFFGFMVALCVLTGRQWFGKARPVAGPIVGKARRGAIAALALVGVQEVLGAWLRHQPSRLGLMVHATAALLVLGHVGMIAVRYGRARSPLTELVPAARALGLLLVLQVALGVGAWWMLRPFDGIPRAVSMFQALIRTGHQANAALLVAAAVVLVMRAYGQVVPGAGSGPDDTPGRSPARELEAVA